MMIKQLVILRFVTLAASLTPTLTLSQHAPQPQQQQLTQQPTTAQLAPTTQGAVQPTPIPAANLQQGQAQQQSQIAFPQHGYQPNTSYPAGTVPQNGFVPMPPLTPPSHFEQAKQIISPFSSDEIIKLRQQLDESRKAKAYRPLKTVPRISSISVDLSPGAALPIARILPGETTTLLFLDSTGAPWPLAALPRVSDPRYFDAEWLQDTSSVVISAQSAYEDGNLTIFLQGLATPVVVKLATGEPDSKNKNRIVDYRLDLRVPGRGPNARAPFLGPGKIALYDDTMQAFLDGIPPKEAKLVTAQGAVPARTQVWQHDGAMFVRTSYDIQTAFDQSIASGDGTRVYRLPPTPYVTLSDMGRSIILQLDIS